MTIRTSLVAGVMVVTAATAAPSGRAPQQQVAADNPVWLQRVQRWIQAATHHQPRHDDAEARAIAVWPRTDLRTVLDDLLALRDLLAQAHSITTGPPETNVITYGEGKFPAAELQRVLGLSDDEAWRGNWNRVLWAGALLHTDVAIVVPPEDRRGPGTAVRFRDGRPDGYQYPVAAHWEMARSLLDAIRPDPSRDQTVLLWYRATAAHLQATLALSDASMQLDRGRKLFPSDADLLFFSGCLHEAYTAPDFQNAVRSMVLPPGQTLNIGSPTSHLQEAESFFRKALAQNERLTEARVRLGRVLGLLGRHEEAAEDLRRAAVDAGDPQVSYYACLLLGEEERALGHRDAARDWYERAAATYGRAQSPLLALSHLALVSGDDRAAAGAIERVHGLSIDDQAREDPWVEYYYTAGRHAPELLDALMAALPDGVRR